MESSNLYSSSTLVVLTMERSTRMTGYASHSRSSSAMASPSNSSRLPSKYAFRVETSSDLPKRRGRLRKKYLPPAWVSSQMNAVLST